MSRCAAIKPNGERCKIQAIPDAQWCWSHHPDYEQARHRRATRAGKAGGRGRPSVELHRLQERFEGLADKVLSGEIERGVGAVAGQLLNGARACVRAKMDAVEQEEFESRLSELEQALASRKKNRQYG